MNLHASPTLTTERLILRGFVDDDLEPLAVMNADSEVMRYLGGVRSREWSAASIDRCRSQWGELGFGRAYVAGDLDSGFYVNFVFHADSQLITKLRSKFKLDPEVYRQHYQRLREKKEKPAKKKVAGPAAKKKVAEPAAKKKQSKKAAKPRKKKR